jgi:hypothetical protein
MGDRVQPAGALFAHKTRVLLVLSQDVLDRARALAGTATTMLKLPVSLQIVLRALIEEGLRRRDDPALLRNVERQAQAVRRIRSAVRRVVGGRRARGTVTPNRRQPARAQARPSGRKSTQT